MCLERHVCRHLVSGPPGRGCAGSRARGLVGVTVLSPSRPKEPAWASGKPGKLSLTKSAPQPQAWTKDSSSLLQNMIFENVLESKCVPFLMSPPRESQHSILSHWFWLVSCSDFFQDGPGTSHQFWLVRFFFFFFPQDGPGTRHWTLKGIVLTVSAVRYNRPLKRLRFGPAGAKQGWLIKFTLC